LHIVLVEDNPADVRLLQEFLLEKHEREIQLTVCQDGDEAIECIFRRGACAGMRQPDLVLLDLNLPKRSGYDVLQEMKAQSETRSVPVVILSSSSAAGDIRKAYDMHANSYIPKAATLEGVERIAKVILDFWLGPVALPHRGLSG
jgi:CheY-like chemotaxis protein